MADNVRVGVLFVSVIAMSGCCLPAYSSLLLLRLVLGVGQIMPALVPPTHHIGGLGPLGGGVGPCSWWLCSCIVLLSSRVSCRR